MVRDVDGWHIGRWYRGGEKRREYRASVDTVTARCESQRGVALCDVEDLSMEGARMAAGLPVGSEVMIELYLPNDERIRTPARVVHRLYPEKSVGLVFHKLSEAHRALIQELIDEARARSH